jgi:hypothetical protein
MIFENDILLILTCKDNILYSFSSISISPSSFFSLFLHLHINDCYFPLCNVMSEITISHFRTEAEDQVKELFFPLQSTEPESVSFQSPLLFSITHITMFSFNCLFKNFSQVIKRIITVSV